MAVPLVEEREGLFRQRGARGSRQRAIVGEPRQCIAFLDQLIAFHEQLDHGPVAIDEDILPLDRLQNRTPTEGAN